MKELDGYIINMEGGVHGDKSVSDFFRRRRLRAEAEIPSGGFGDEFGHEDYYSELSIAELETEAKKKIDELKTKIDEYVQEQKEIPNIIKNLEKKHRETSSKLLKRKFMKDIDELRKRLNEIQKIIDATYVERKRIKNMFVSHKDIPEGMIYRRSTRPVAEVIDQAQTDAGWLRSPEVSLDDLYDLDLEAKPSLVLDVEMTRGVYDKNYNDKVLNELKEKFKKYL